MNRLLLFLLPDRREAILAWLMSSISFLLALLDMVTRDFDSARFHLNLSVLILASLFVIRYLSMRASYEVAQDAEQQVQQHIRKVRQTRTTDISEAARERAEMAEMARALKLALSNIEPNSPIRPKYEATLEMLLRFSSRA